MKQRHQQTIQQIQSAVNGAKDPANKNSLIKKGWTVVEIGNVRVADFNQSVGQYLLSNHDDEFIAKLCDIPTFLFRVWREPTEKEQKAINRESAFDKPFDPDEHEPSKRLTKQYRVARWKLDYMVGNAWMREFNVSSVNVPVGQLIKPTEDSAVLWLPRGTDILDQIEQISKGGNTVLYMLIDDVNTLVSIDPTLRSLILDKISELQAKHPIINHVETAAVVATHAK